MTPNDIEILIHCHTTPSIHPRSDAPAVKRALSDLAAHGLIAKRPNEEFYTTTDRGKAHIAILCSAAMPICKWVDAHGNVIQL